MGQRKRDSYKCHLCRNAADTSSQQSTDSETPELNTKSVSSSDTTKYPFDMLFKRLSDMETGFKTATENQTKVFQEKIDELTNTVQFCSDKFDEFAKEMSNFRNRVVEVEKVNKILEAKNTALETRVETLETALESMQQYDRRCNIQLDGVPQVRDEDVLRLVVLLAEAVDEQLDVNTDIQAAHRLPSRNTERPKPIVIQFTNRQKRDAVLMKAKTKGFRLKSTDFVRNVPETLVYANDHLTPYYKKLLYEAKKVKSDKHYEFLWVKNAKIFIRKDKNSNVLRLDSFKDLDKL